MVAQLAWELDAVEPVPPSSLGPSPEDPVQQPAQRGHLPHSRQYDIGYARSYCLWVHAVMAAGEMGLHVLNLHSTTWPTTLIAEIPLLAVGHLATASSVVCCLCPKYPTLSLWAFALMTSAPMAVLIGVGRRSWYFVSWIVAFLMWSVLFFPQAKNISLTVVNTIITVVMQLGLLIFVENLATIKSSMPRLLQGVLMPSLVVFYEAVSSILFCRGWRRFYRSVVPLQLFNIVPIMVVQTGEGMRLVGLLTASLHPDRGHAFAEMAMAVGFSVASDILSRSLRVQQLLWRAATGKAYQVTPEHDAFLRARFEYGYTSFIYVLATASVMNIHGIGWASQPLLWVAMATGLTAEVFTDAAFVLLHWRASSRAESPIQTLQRLLTPGGHEVLGQYTVSPAIPYEPEADEDVGAAEAQNVGATEAQILDAKCVPVPVRILLQLLVADIARTSVSAAMYGNLGSCNDWFSGELCSRAS